MSKANSKELRALQKELEAAIAATNESRVAYALSERRYATARDAIEKFMAKNATDAVREARESGK